MKDSFDREIEDITPAQKPSSLKKAIHLLTADDQLEGAFKYNLFTHEVEHAQDNIILSPSALKGRVVGDADVSCLRSYLAKKYNFSTNRNNIDDALLDISMNSKYHPIKEYLERLQWDGTSRLNGWLHRICGAEDNDYSSAVGRKMFVAAVKRIYEPGCYYAQLVVLEGRQRMFKSRLVKEIGQEWYASIHLKTNDTKTIVEEMRGKWILEIEELAGFSKQDTEYMKAFVSRQSDRVRLSYGRKADDFPRQSIMIATMNPESGENRYLVDHTGNVRYWPIKCFDDEKIKIDEFKECRDQLFAEAVALYRKGESLWLIGKDEEGLAEVEQEKRLSSDPWSPIVIKWLEDKMIVPNIELTTEQVAKDCLAISFERINSGHTRRIGRILHEAGWVRHRRTTKPREWYYTSPDTNEDMKIVWEDKNESV